MTQFDKIREQWALWLLGDLGGAEGERLTKQLAKDPKLLEEFQEFKALWQALKEMELPPPGDIFFRRQLKEIQGRLAQEEDEANLTAWILGENKDPQWAQRVQVEERLRQSAEETRALIQELKSLAAPDRGEAFFQNQLLSIRDQITEAEDQAEVTAWAAGDLPQAESLGVKDRVEASGDLQREVQTTRDLILDLQGLPVEDPGELFFRRQLHNIQNQLPREREFGPQWKRWLRPMAVAAALFFLVLGIYRVNELQDQPGSGDWQMALEEIAEESEPLSGLGEWEELNSQQLDQLAGNLEGTLLLESEETFGEEPGDWDEFNHRELDQLIQRMEVTAQT